MYLLDSEKSNESFPLRATVQSPWLFSAVTMLSTVFIGAQPLSGRVRLLCGIRFLSRVTSLFRNEPLRDERISKRRNFRSSVDWRATYFFNCFHFTRAHPNVWKPSRWKRVHGCSFVYRLSFHLLIYLRSIWISVYLGIRFQDSHFQI